jgi:PHD/YefM family antitoxin component YafN of YafNO toxin-antitoxin module
MITEKFWSKDRFPLVYENNEPKAVIIDMKTFEKIDLILNNLMNRETESEDRLLSASGLLEKLMKEAGKSSASEDWRAELDEL